MRVASASKDADFPCTSAHDEEDAVREPWAQHPEFVHKIVKSASVQEEAVESRYASGETKVHMPVSLGT